MKMKTPRGLFFSAITLVSAGLLFISYSLWNMYEQQNQLSTSLTQAKHIIEENNEKQNVLSGEQIPTFKTGESIGILKIPALDAELPIIEGTDEDELEKGVGHYSATHLPGQNDQILLSGHRDTVFRRLGELEIGDVLQVVMPYGEFHYVIQETFIVNSNDTTVIKSTAPTETLTLSTCYPFSYIGNAPERYILHAVLQ